MDYVTVEIELDDFDDSELIEELESRGYTCTSGKVAQLDIDRIEHLAVCGQIEAARAEALELVSKAIERDL